MVLSRRRRRSLRSGLYACGPRAEGATDLRSSSARSVSTQHSSTLQSMEAASSSSRMPFGCREGTDSSRTSSDGPQETVCTGRPLAKTVLRRSTWIPGRRAHLRVPDRVSPHSARSPAPARCSSGWDLGLLPRTRASHLQKEHRGCPDPAREPVDTTAAPRGTDPVARAWPLEPAHVVLVDRATTTLHPTRCCPAGT